MLPADYAERVYAGVLGKLIGVYLGRPFEGWSYEAIAERLGDIEYYVHDKLDKPLIVTDDDITGTFTFARALADCGCDPNFTPADVGDAWLNYNIENRTILWWGGMGVSTENTAYLRLKAGMRAPDSGSIASNGKVVAEQIGAQIFIDVWPMVCPGDAERAADFARRAASVSHDGEAIYGAVVLAVMESLAFVESDIDRLLDEAVSFIPADSVIHRMIADLRRWRQDASDWRKARKRLAASYGYDTYGGGCHMVPNHGLIILSLLYGDGDFAKTLMIVNTCGWDTDCNSGNVGCLMGIRNGLEGLDAGPDWRGPLADRLYLPTADGGRAITDAATEALHIINMGRALAGEAPLAPKGGARFHFQFPGSVQTWRPDADSADALTVESAAGPAGNGDRGLALRYDLPAGGSARAFADTFIPYEARDLPGYGLLASPTIFPGQSLAAAVAADDANAAPVTCRLYLRHYGEDDELVRIDGPHAELAPGESHEFAWTVPPTGRLPIAAVGVELSSAIGGGGDVYLDYLTWSGAPAVTLARPKCKGRMWMRAWVNGADKFFCRDSGDGPRLHVVQNAGVGVVSQGTAEWTDYRAEAEITPHLADACGLAVRCGGMKRYYAVRWVRGGRVQLVKMCNELAVLAETRMDWDLGESHALAIQACGDKLTAWIDGERALEAADTDRPLTAGGVALVSEVGRMLVGAVKISPVDA